MMTTIVDHNDIRLQPIKRVTREAKSQVSDGNRQRAVSCHRQASAHALGCDA